MDEAGIIKDCLSGSQKAWSDFIDRFAGLIRWAVINKLSRINNCPNNNDINDIVQKIFLDIWQDRSLGTIRNPKALRPWLVIKAQNASVDYLRRNFKLRADPIGQDQIESFQSKQNPRDEACSSQLYDEVDNFISRLTLKEKRIISLELYYDMKQREIAGIMGLPLNTVSTIICRIKESLKIYLKKRGYDV